MPFPLKSDESIYVEHKIKDGSYSMPTMQAATDHYTMGYLVKGDRKWLSYERIGIAHSGDVGINKPNVYHRNCALSDTPYDRYLIKFRLEVLQPVIDIIGQSEFELLCSDYLHFTKASQKKIHAQFEEMLIEYNKHTPYSQIISQGMLQKLFITVFQEHLPLHNQTLQLNKFDARIHDALIYIENNLIDNPSIESSANAASLSVSHFSRLFKEVVGCSYTDYLTDVKLQRAEFLLKNTKMTISQIAEKTGFSTPNYMSSVFTKKHHIPPTEYRKKGVLT